MKYIESSMEIKRSFWTNISSQDYASNPEYYLAHRAAGTRGDINKDLSKVNCLFDIRDYDLHYLKQLIIYGTVAEIVYIYCFSTAVQNEPNVYSLSHGTHVPDPILIGPDALRTH